MKKFSTYLVVMFMIVFWIVRIVVTLASQFGGSFLGMVPMNEAFEIGILFGTLLSLVLIVKRKMSGALLYLILHAIYFGSDVTIKLNMMAQKNALSFSQNVQLIFSLLGIILPIAVLLDLLLDKNRKYNPKDKKTDWFYKNENFDRQLDDRVDKNNYRTM